MYVSGGLGSLQDKGDHDYSSSIYLKLIKLGSPTPDGPLTEINMILENDVSLDSTFTSTVDTVNSF